MSLTVCRDGVYMLGRWGDEAGSIKPQSVLACSLADLFQSGISESSGSVQRKRDVWHSISSIPANNCTWSTLCTVSVKERTPELVVCTVDQSESISTNYQNTANSGIYRYNQTTSMWEFVDNVPSVRLCCMAVMVSNSEMMVIGDLDSVSSHPSVNIILCSFNSA